MAEEKVLLQVEGMTCEGCAQTIERALKRDKGIKKVQIDWRSGKAEVTFSLDETDPLNIVENRVFQGHYKAKMSSPGCC